MSETPAQIPLATLAGAYIRFKQSERARAPTAIE
jgi:hypothetical protein